MATILAEPFQGLERLILIMGYQCNARCSMCYQTDFSAKFNMPAVIYKQKLKNAYPQVKSVKIQGGEPTIMPNCREVAEILRHYPQIKITLTTNGISISEFWHETFLSQCGYINFSVNAATEESYNKIVQYGNFKKVLGNIERLMSKRASPMPPVSISMVVLNENVRELHDFIKLGNNLGVDEVYFIVDPILSFNLTLPEKEIIAEIERAEVLSQNSRVRVDGLNSFKRHFKNDDSVKAANSVKCQICPMPFRTLVVENNGDLKLCCDTWIKIGNLNKNTLEELWRGAKAEQFRKRIKGNNYLWCEPYCPDNPNPSKYALPYKYWSFFTEDPMNFFNKVRSKIKKLKK